MHDRRVLIFVVTYNAEDHISSTLVRIPKGIFESYNCELLIVDDASHDATYQRCQYFKNNNSRWAITVAQNQHNLGYGGNQKLGYQYAIDNEFDVVVLLHGDGQYAPEKLDNMIQPILSNDADVILGSRMLDKRLALQGGMPLYKWVGNQILTTVQNWILDVRLAEFHTGYRAYAVEALKQLPIKANSDYFDFDTEILIQLIDNNYRFKEISIPTFYGDEISYVNGLKYAWLIIKSTIKSRMVRRGYVKDKRFQYNDNY